MLNGKRVLVLVPDAADVSLTNPAAYAYARGGVADAAGEQLNNDLNTRIASSLGSYLDSNTVLSYKNQPVGGIIPLSAKTDFTQTDAVDWDKVKRAGREGNVDYLVVLRSMQIDNTASTSGGRGGEAIKAHYILIDAQRGKTMTNGDVSVNVKEMNGPADSYQQLARELSSRLPFTVGAGMGK
jgi:hypothetical protein